MLDESDDEEEEDENVDRHDTEANQAHTQWNIAEDKQCRVCKESMKQITQLEVFKVKVNNVMMQGTQDALSKANELLSHYSQYLPEDYNYDSDEDYGYSDQDLEQFASKSLSAISGFFSKIKSTFEETKKPNGGASTSNKQLKR